MKLLSTLFFLFVILSAGAQSLTEKTDISIYEHHSSSMTGQDFGFGANGSMSGYDFVAHSYINSFDDGSFNPWADNHPVVQNIDLVEHNGPFTSAFNFGFTAGNSSIWQSQGPPYIRGNGSTMYVKAPASFNYETVSEASVIANEYKKGTPSPAVEAVENGAVYLVRIRNTNQYAAIKITDIINDNGAAVTDVYFTFDYKYGTVNPSSAISDISPSELNLVHNRNSISINILNNGLRGSALSLYNAGGQRVYEGRLDNNTIIETQGFTNGIYFLTINLPDNRILSRKLILEN